MKKHFKRLLSMAMAVLLCLGLFPSNAFAADNYDGFASIIDHPTRGFSMSSDLPAPFGGYSSDKFCEIRINDRSNFRTAYCIEFGVGIRTGVGYESTTQYDGLTSEQESLVNTALTLGYNVETGTKYGGSAFDEYLATQIFIWLVVHGQLDSSYENRIVDDLTANSPGAKTIFHQLREDILNYHTIPSFATSNSGSVGA